MSNFTSFLRNIGIGKLLIGGLLILTILFTLIFGISTFTKPVMTSLMQNLSASDAAAVTRTLENQGIKYSVSDDGTVVSVARSDKPKAMMLLAEVGLPKSKSIGWELFDQGNGFGMTSFTQKVNRLRALEGELARSIMTMNKIENARVHLVLPEREAFAREAPKATASVIVTTSGSFTMERTQALAIRHLVSSAVPDLEPSSVTVMTSTGVVLLSEDSGNIASDSALQGAKATIEEGYRRDLQELLMARVGAGNARVQVSVELNTDRVVTILEEFNPDQQVVRSTETSQENEDNAQSDNSNVSVETNLPNANNGSAGGAMISNKRNSFNEVINYEIGSKKIEQIREPGSIAKISVAVLLNGIYNKTDKGVEYQDRTPQEIERIADLVRHAVGFDADRGDAVQVDSFRFIDYSSDLGEPLGTSFSDILKEHLADIIKWLIVLAIVAIIMFAGVRPVLNSVVAQRKAEEEAERIAIESALAAETADAVMEDSDVGLDVNAEQDSLVSFMNVKGGVRSRKLKSLSDVVTNEPEEARRVLKMWIQSNMGTTK